MKGAHKSNSAKSRGAIGVVSSMSEAVNGVKELVNGASELSAAEQVS